MSYVTDKRQGIDDILKYAMSLYLEDASIENSLPLPTPPPFESSITLTAQESDQKDNRTVSLLDVPAEEKPLRQIPIAVPKSELAEGHAAWVRFLEHSDSKVTGYTKMGGDGYLFKFKGCCVDGIPTGMGKLTFIGGRYNGSFEKGLFNGFGVRHYDDGHRYEGEFLNGCTHGEGTMFYANGEQHKGTFEKGEISGPGVFTTYDGKCIARGMFSNEGLEGEGEYIEYGFDESLLEPTSTVIWYKKGEFKKGILEGKGEQTDEFGNKYIGGFQNGIFHGEGTYEYESGSVLTCTYVLGKATGPGVLKSDDGRRIWKGNFIDSVLEGEGEFTVLKDPEGTPDNKILYSYKGNYSNDEITGEGVEILENGDKYTGTFKEGEHHGKGILEIKENGDIFSGTFVEGDMHGQCVVMRGNGTKWEITYVEGLPINGIIHYTKDGKRERVTFNNEGDVSSRTWIQAKSKK